MDWLIHLHGWRALEVGWAITAVPLWVGLLQERAPLTKWFLSPLATAACLGIAAGELRWLLSEGGIADTSLAATWVSVVCFVAIGYVGGRRFYGSRSGGSVVLTPV